MKNIGEEYASALYELAEETKAEDVILPQMDEISSLLAENPGYARLLDNPTLDVNERVSMANEAFSGVSEYLKNFIMILVEAKRFSCFNECAKAFSRLYDLHHNILRAEAVTASPLDAKQADAIKEKLERKTGKTVILTNTVDAGIIGGVLLKYGGEQIDRSVKSSLKAISNVISKADV